MAEGAPNLSGGVNATGARPGAVSDPGALVVQSRAALGLPVQHPDQFPQSRPAPERTAADPRPARRYVAFMVGPFDRLMRENLTGSRSVVHRPPSSVPRGRQEPLGVGGPAVYRPQPVPWDRAYVVGAPQP